MKIVYLHQYFNTPEMAGSTRSFEMGRRLVELGHEVSMITSWREDSDKTDWFTSDEAGMKVFWLPLVYNNEMTYGARIKAFFRFALRSARLATSIQADVVFATSTPLTIILPGFLAAKKQKIPLVFEVRDLWPEVPIELGILRNPILVFLAKKLELFAYKQSCKIVALAPGMAANVIAKGVEEKHVTVIPNGCDLALFEEDDQVNVRSQYQWLGERPLILYTGTLGLVNGVSYLVDVASSLADILPEARVVIVGAGKEYKQIRDYAERLGILNKNLFMLGSIPKIEAARWVIAADITTSMICNKEVLWKNAVTNKFFDSMAAGKPIACNHYGWQTEIAEKENTGILLDPENPEKGAMTLKKALLDEAWLEQAGQNAKRIATEQFSRDKLAIKLENTLKQAIDERQAY